MLDLRVGTGFDVHAFAPGRRCVLGGVCVPHERGLAGHSDADVLVHAVMDALLGAAALPDIGRLFPDDDAAYLDADSLGLLAQVGARLAETGYALANVDATIIAQAPRMAPYIEQMRANIAGALGVEPARVGVKATTTEHLGFTGRKEGIAAQAVALIYAL